jgi:hypothetical protein
MIQVCQVNERVDPVEEKREYISCGMNENEKTEGQMLVMNNITLFKRPEAGSHSR